MEAPLPRNKHRFFMIRPCLTGYQRSSSFVLGDASLWKFKAFYTDSYRDKPLIYSKKASYAAVLATFIVSMITITFPLALYDLGFDPLMISTLLGILALALSSLLMIRKGSLEAAVNVLLTLGTMRILMLFADPYAILFYVTTAVIIISIAICQVKQYQIVLPSVLILIIHGAKLWQQYRLFKEAWITQVVLDMHFFGFLHVILLEIIGFFIVYIINSEIRKSEELIASRETLTQYTSQLQELNLLLEDAASRDRLTGAFNRRKMDEIIAHEANRDLDGPQFLSLIMFDMDDFKQINDTYGHKTGDEVLARTAQTVLAEIRKTDYLIRWGGEEFLVLLFREEPGGTQDMAERLRHLIAQLRYKLPGEHEHGISVTASFGYAIQQDNETLDMQINRADSALYAAKRAGKNCVSGESEV